MRPLQDMLGPDQGYYDGMYEGPPSVHSSHGGRQFGNQGESFKLNEKKL